MAKANAKSAVYSMEKANEMMKQYVKADQDYTKKENELAKKTNDLKAKYAEGMTESETLKKQAEAWLGEFANANPQLFEESKKVEIGSGEIGYRTCKPKVTFTDDEQTVFKQLKKFIPGAIKTTEAIDKAKLLSDRKELDEKTLVKCGIEIVQDEIFYAKSLEKIV